MALLAGEGSKTLFPSPFSMICQRPEREITERYKRQYEQLTGARFNHCPSCKRNCSVYYVLRVQRRVYNFVFGFGNWPALETIQFWRKCVLIYLRCIFNGRRDCPRSCLICRLAHARNTTRACLTLRVVLFILLCSTAVQSYRRRPRWRKLLRRGDAVPCNFSSRRLKPFKYSFYLLVKNHFSLFQINIPKADLEEVGLELAGKGGLALDTDSGGDAGAPPVVGVSVVTVNPNQNMILFANTEFLESQAKGEVFTSGESA